MISVSNFVAGFIILGVLSVGFTFHLGWRHGWTAGFASGKIAEPLDDPQPRVKHLFGFIYALGWHKGWDYGFRDAVRKNEQI